MSLPRHSDAFGKLLLRLTLGILMLFHGVSKLMNPGWTLELQAFYLFCGLTVFFLGSGRTAARPD